MAAPEHSRRTLTFLMMNEAGFFSTCKRRKPGPRRKTDQCGLSSSLSCLERLDITFKNTNCLKEVTPEQRLSTFLHFMATGKLIKLRAEMAFVSGNGSND